MMIKHHKPESNEASKWNFPFVLLTQPHVATVAGAKSICFSFGCSSSKLSPQSLDGAGDTAEPLSFPGVNVSQVAAMTLSSMSFESKNPCGTGQTPQRHKAFCHQ